MSEADGPADGQPSQKGISSDMVVEMVPDALLVIDLEDQETIRANEAAGELFACSPEELEETDPFLTCTKDSAEEIRSRLESGFEQEQISRRQDGQPLYIETFEGEKVPVEINVQSIQSETGEIILAVFRKIEQQVKREQRLKRFSSRFEAFLDAVPLPAAVLDLDGTVELWNQAAEETYGYTEDEIDGELYPLFTDHGELTKQLDRVLEGNPINGYETIHRSKDGAILHVEIYVQPVYVDGVLTGIVGSAIDITGKKRQNRMLDVLHRVLRHNLRNKLNVVQGSAEWLIDRVEREKAEMKVAEQRQIRDAAETIIAGVNELIELSEQARETRELVKNAQEQSTSTTVFELEESFTEVTGNKEITTHLSEPEDRYETLVPRESEQIIRALGQRIDSQPDVATVMLDINVNPHYVEVTISADEALLPDSDRALIELGRETAVRHEEGLDIAQACLVTTAIGGNIEVPDTLDADTLEIEIPCLSH